MATHTRDNLHLSRPKVDSPLAAQVRAINCAEAVPDDVVDLISRSICDRTRRAYQSDLDQFLAWGGEIPASPTMVASYLAAHADSLSTATLGRRLVTISKAHEALSLANPCRAEIVKATLRGIRRTRGTAQRQAKPLVREDLVNVLDSLASGFRDTRDRALLLLGFAGAFRRSELVGLDHGDVQHVRQGLVVTLRFCKTDQEGIGRKIGIPHGRTRNCPVAALEAWVSLSGSDEGPIFRPIDKQARVGEQRLSPEAVSLIVKERVAAAGLDPTGYSGHSLRSGFATSAAQAGVSTLKIRAQTGHASDTMLARYIRDGELFVGNATGALL